MTKKVLFASLSAVVLLGAGCMTANTTPNTSYSTPTPDTGSSDNDAEENPYVALSCDDGMKLFQGTRHDIEFCYPENNGSDEGAITVKEEADGVVLSVNGEAMRKIWVVDVDEKKSHESIVQGYAVKDPEGVTCSVVDLDDDIDGRHMYVIEGEDEQGGQDLATVTACTYLESEDEDGFDANMQRSGGFYFYDRKPGLMYILTGEQDASLGERTEEFTDSMQPKK